MPEHFGEVGYTPPAAEWESDPANREPYLAGHAAGWTHANFHAAVADIPPDQTFARAADRFATEHYEPDSRPWLRAREGFIDGAAAFNESVNGD